MKKLLLVLILLLLATNGFCLWQNTEQIMNRVWKGADASSTTYPTDSLKVYVASGTVAVVGSSFENKTSTYTAGIVTDLTSLTVTTNITNPNTVSEISFIAIGGDCSVFTPTGGTIPLPSGIGFSMTFDMPTTLFTNFKTTLTSGSSVYYSIKGVK